MRKYERMVHEGEDFVPRNVTSAINILAILVNFENTKEEYGMTASFVEKISRNLPICTSIFEIFTRL